MTRLYADENFPRPVVETLREQGYDVLTAQDAGNADQSIPDDKVLDFATREARAILTLNRKHFLRLHEAQPSHAGIIICTFDPEFERQATQIDHALQQTSALAGQLLRVNRPVA